MEERYEGEGELKEQFETLSQNLRRVVDTAWKREERKTVQREIQAGLAAFSAAVKELYAQYSESEAGQQIKREVEQMTEKARSTEAEKRARQELVSILTSINQQLEEAAVKLETPPKEGESPPA